MEKSWFIDRFGAAVERLLEFSRPIVDGTLPDRAVFRVLLNSSYDGHAEPSVHRLFPDDSSPERALALRKCSFEDAVDVLWRDGAVPEWLDMSVIGETGHATYVQLVCCGRFTWDESRLYHKPAGLPPFSIKGPEHLNSRVECVNLEEAQDLKRIAKQVRFLTLVGDDFTDSVLEELPRFPHLFSLTLRQTSVHGRGLRPLDRYQELDTLEVHLGQHELDFSHLPTLPEVVRLRLSGLSENPLGTQTERSKFPKLTVLELACLGELELSLDVLGEFPRLSSLTLRAGTALRVVGHQQRELGSMHLETEGQLDLPCTLLPPKFDLTVLGQYLAAVPKLPSSLTHLKLALRRPGEGAVAALLEQLEEVKYLDLRTTPTDKADMRLAESLQRLSPGRLLMST